MLRPILGLALSLAACGSSHSDPGLFNGTSSSSGGGAGPVGAPCHTNADCAGVCASGGDFSNICTLPCKSDANCPSGTLCVDGDGGMCAVVCRFNSDCASFGGQLTCKSRDRIGTSGVASVCRKG
jgi:hypothetical protein